MASLLGSLRCASQIIIILFSRICMSYLTDDCGDELRLVVRPLWTLDKRRLISDHQAAVPAEELAAVVDAVVEWEHLTWAVLDGTVTVHRLCRNGHVLLYVVRQVFQLRHATPVRHLARNENDMDCIGSVNSKNEDSDEHSPLVGTHVSNVRVEIFLFHPCITIQK